MNQINLDELKKQYELTDEALGKSAEIIFNKYTYGRNNSKNPFSVIVLGQAGAGKSGLMSYTSNQFESAIALDIDDLRAYYPRYDEVANNHPEIFEAVTGGFASKMILLLTPVLVENGYNLILHKTRGDKAIIDDTINYLKDNNYNIILRVMAVHELESKMSALERSLAQFDNIGHCRWVETAYHDKHYNGIVDLAEFLADNGYTDATEIFVRGKNPVLPPKVYGIVTNPNLLNNTNLLDENGLSKVHNYKTQNFKGVRDAIEKTRDEAVPEILEKIPERIKRVSNRADYKTSRAPEFMDEIIKVISQVKQKD